jgi:hypothetical protein
VRVRTSSSRAWLSLTPEPERELPAAIAVLRRAGEARADACGGDAGPDIEREIARAEALVLRGSEPSYLAWLREAAELAARADGDDDPAVAHAAAVVREVVRNQAGLLLGLPGGGHRREAAQRALEAVGGNP